MVLFGCAIGVMSSVERWPFLGVAFEITRFQFEVLAQMAEENQD